MCRRLQDSEKQEVVRRHSGTCRAGRVGGQVRAAGGWHGGLRVTIPVVHGYDRHPADTRRIGHPSAVRTIVVARLAVRVPVRHPIVAIAVPCGQDTAAALSSVSVSAAAAEQHRVTRHRQLLCRAAGGRQLDSGHSGRRRWR